jgi:hypothetical protein
MKLDDLKDEKGFTIIEVALVGAIIAIVGSVFYAGYENYNKRRDPLPIERSYQQPTATQPLAQQYVIKRGDVIGGTGLEEYVEIDGKLYYSVIDDRPVRDYTPR